MSRGLAFKQVRCVVLCTAVVCSSVYAQSTAKQVSSSNSADEFPDLVELDPFGGCSLFGAVNRGSMKLVNGGTVGGRVTWNFSTRWGSGAWL